MKELKCPVCGKMLNIEFENLNERVRLELKCRNLNCMATFMVDNIPDDANIKKLVEHYAQILPKWTWG